ncbi:MAG: nucleotidyl transferase AbiEii/AbiGii toxin family protein [Clostridia bacterium]|nr:nucleotidyl transferase AbiEii/AbiGii toxin family protein [Clostridia bacterium]
MKNLRQIKDRINNIAKKKNINAQVLLRNYMMERLLERISLSEYKDVFILKGGMLVAAMVGIDMRSTIDMDTTIKNYPATLENIQKALEDIINVEIDDGVFMNIKKISEIREDDVYNGFRVSLDAKLDNAIIPMKIDITTGDRITPGEITYKYRLLLEDRSIQILAYNIETIIAEKTETLIVRGVTNTRMRDFYDLYILMKLQSQDIRRDFLKEAIFETAEKRNSTHYLQYGREVINEIFEDAILMDYWLKYQREYSYAEGISWKEIKDTVVYIWNMTEF